MPRLKKITEFVNDHGVKVVILGDVETNGQMYAEAILVWPK